MKVFLATLALSLFTPSAMGCQVEAKPAPQETAVPLPADALPADSPLRQVVFAGGCFWCTELVFEALEGVEAVVSGYAGGTAETATYKAVSAGKSDHAEVIQVTYDPKKISYEQLLDVFFSVAHDPTQLNRQGPDHGRQYRSAVFFSDEKERATVQAYIDRLDEAKSDDKPIATTLEPLKGFYPAEDYHQDFVKRNPRHGYVVQNALPKLEKLRKQFKPLLRK